jgi:protein BUR2
MDTIKLNEDVLLELLCFDLTVDSPYKLLYDLLRQFGLHHNKKLRDAAWAFINDSNMTQLCLLFPSRTIAATALYYAAKMTEVELPEDEQGRSWWDVQKVELKQVKTAMNYMADFYESSPLKAGSGSSTYAAARTPIDDDVPDTRSVTRSPLPPTPRPIDNSDNSKRGREDDENNDVEASDDKANGHLRAPMRVPIHTLTGEPSEKRPKIHNGDTNYSFTQEKIANGDVQNKENDEGSEEGELEE